MDDVVELIYADSDLADCVRLPLQVYGYFGNHPGDIAGAGYNLLERARRAVGNRGTVAYGSNRILYELGRTFCSLGAFSGQIADFIGNYGKALSGAPGSGPLPQRH